METAEAPPETVAYQPKQTWRPSLDLIVLTLSVALASVPAYLAGRVSQGALTQLGPFAVRPTYSIDLFVLAFLLVAGPYSILIWRRQAARTAMENRIPDFLNDIAALHKAGLTLPDAIVSASAGNYGPLTPHITWAAEQIRWNLPVLQVLANLRDRVATPIALRSLTVVIEAGRSGGNVPEVLEVTAKNTQAFVNMRESRRRAMAMYTMIMYVASFVFIGVALSLQGLFVPKMLEAFGQAGMGGAGGSGMGFATLPPRDSFRSLFYVAAIVQGVGNGFVAGIISDGRLSGGLRHACLMTLLAALGFLVSG